MGGSQNENSFLGPPNKSGGPCLARAAHLCGVLQINPQLAKFNKFKVVVETKGTIMGEIRRTPPPPKRDAAKYSTSTDSQPEPCKAHSWFALEFRWSPTSKSEASKLPPARSGNGFLVVAV